MSVSLDQFRYFLMAAKLNHVGQAAKSLRISPSAVSGAIAALEDEYSCTLFERVNRRIHLNEKGSMLRDHLLGVIDKIDETKSLLQKNSEQLSGLMTLSGSYFLVEELVGPAASALQKLNPRVRFEIIPAKTSQAISEVLGGLVDVAVCFSPHGHPDLENKVLHSGRLLPVVSKKHPLAKKGKLSTFQLSDLNSYPMIVHKSQAGTDYCENHPALTKVKVNAKVAQYYQSDALCVSAIMESEAWALLPDMVVKRFEKMLCVLPVPDQWSAQYKVCSVFRRSHNSPRVLSILNQEFLARVQSLTGV